MSSVRWSADVHRRAAAGELGREPTSTQRFDSTSDKRFDPLKATQLLLEIAQEHSVEPILKKLVDFAVERTGFAFSTLWLVQ